MAPEDAILDGVSGLGRVRGLAVRSMEEAGRRSAAAPSAYAQFTTTVRRHHT